MEKIIWQASEYEHKEKTPDWYWALGVIAVSSAVISIIYKNYIFAVFIVLASAILFMFSLKKPEIMNMEINEKGVKIKDEFYPFEMIKTFWIENQGGEKKLLLHSSRILMPIIALPIEENLEGRIRSALSNNLKEEEMKEPATQKVMEYFGF